MSEASSSAAVGRQDQSSSTIPAPTHWFRGKGWFWLPIAPLVALDLGSKAWVFEFVEKFGAPTGGPYREYTVFQGPVSFHLTNWTNTGTIWGLGQQFTVPLMVVRCLALVLLVHFARRTPSHHRWILLILGLIMAGALGNLYDNFTQAHRGVRDFLLFFVGHGLHERTAFPAFNVADSCITLGALSLLLVLLKAETPKRSPAG